jgi:hypothetical protein
VWTGVARIFSAADTLEISLNRSGAALAGFGILHMTGEPMAMHTDIHGIVAGERVALHIPGLSDSASAFVLTDGVHLVKVRQGSDTQDVVLTRRAPGPLRDGTYVLSATSGAVAADFDTIVVFADGRGWRHRTQSVYTFAVQTMWSSDAGIVVIEPSAAIPDFMRDTLHVDHGTLVRRTHSLYADHITETFVRVGPPR